MQIFSKQFKLILTLFRYMDDTYSTKAFFQLGLFLDDISKSLISFYGNKNRCRDII